MLRGRYGYGWMIVAWLVIAILIGLAIYGAIGVAALLQRP